MISGPDGLKQIKVFRDEALRCEWKGYRSSRLNIQYRVFYRIEKDQVLVQVVSVTPHDYRKRRNGMKNHHVAKMNIDVSPGESVCILRELQELSQNELSALTGIPHATISAIENNRVHLGVERAKTLAGALKCHPAVLVFPGWDVRSESAA